MNNYDRLFTGNSFQLLSFNNLPIKTRFFAIFTVSN